MLGLTQRALAESDGLQFQQIQKYECGANAMSAERLWRLAKLMDTPVVYFFQGLGEHAARLVYGDPDDAPETAEFLRICAGLDPRSRRTLLALMQSMNGETPALADVQPAPQAAAFAATGG